MSVNIPNMGFKAPIDKDPIVFVINGAECSLPNLQWDLLAQSSIYDAHSTAEGPGTQVLWMLDSFEEASSIVSSIALNVTVSHVDSLRPRMRTIVVAGPAAKHRASYFETVLDDPVMINVGMDRPKASEDIPAGGPGNSMKIIGNNSAHAATIAGIVSALIELSPGSSAQEVLGILFTLANRA